MAMGYMHNKLVKIGYEFPEISLRADRQTHRQTCTSQYSALLLDEVVGDSLACYGRSVKQLSICIRADSNHVKYIQITRYHVIPDKLYPTSSGS